jgi:hypothetical protein
MNKIETKGNTHNLNQSETVPATGSQVLTNSNVSIATKQSGAKSKKKKLSKKEIFDKLKEIENRSDYSPQKINYKRNIKNIAKVLEDVNFQLGLNLNELYILFKDNPQCFVHEVNYNTFNALRTKLKGQKDKIGLLQEENMESLKDYLKGNLAKFEQLYTLIFRMFADFPLKNSAINNCLTIITEIMKLIIKIQKNKTFDYDNCAMRILRFTFKENLKDLSQKLYYYLQEINLLYRSHCNVDQANYLEFLKLTDATIRFMEYVTIETDEDKLSRIEKEWRNIFNVSSITYWFN